MNYYVVAGNNFDEACSCVKFDSLGGARADIMAVARGLAETLGVNLDSDAVQWERGGDGFVITVGEREWVTTISVTQPFLEACLKGDASVEDLYEYVEWWHTHDTGNELHEFLGISLEDYGRWVMTDDITFFLALLDERKNQKMVDALLFDASARSVEPASEEKKHRALVDIVRDAEARKQKNVSSGEEEDDVRFRERERRPVKPESELGRY